MKLFIVESPGKVKKIQGFLGSTFRVMASVGHVRDLPEKKMGVEPPAFVPEYVATERGKEVLVKLQAAAQNAESVYLATDPDREGEAIAWHIAQALHLDSPRRVTYTEITAGAVRQAVEHPRTIDDNLVSAQEGRRVLDRLVGYMVSPVLSGQNGMKLSAGRVQSPAVRLVVERERAIQAFNVTVHYGVDLSFAVLKNIEPGWKASWLPEEKYNLDQALAGRVATIRALTVVDCQETESISAPPPPFVTSTLQQAASSTLKLNPKRTMELAQKLYEQGHITYMRTDSPNLSAEAIAAIRSWAGQHDFPLPPTTRTWKSKAGAQEAHEAIRPTHIEQEEAGATADEKALYQLIRLRTIASQLEDAVYDVRTLTMEGEVDGGKRQFEARGRQLVRQGWKALVATDQTEDTEKEKDAENQVPHFDIGARVTAQDGQVVTRKTKPPARYTEASLIRELEKQGIGRPSTYAAILDNIITYRKYLRIEKRQLFPTDLGIKTIDALSGHFGFLEYDFTSALEDDLDQIAAGAKQYLPIVTAAFDRLQGEMAVYIDETSPKCPECGKPLRHMHRPESRVKKGYNFWACTGYPECRVTFADAGGALGERQDNKPAPVTSEYKCPECGQPLIRRTGTSKKTGKQYDFYGCSGFRNGCQATFPVNKEGAPEYAGSTGKI